MALYTTSLYFSKTSTNTQIPYSSSIICLNTHSDSRRVEAYTYFKYEINYMEKCKYFFSNPILFADTAFVLLLRRKQ